MEWELVASLRPTVEIKGGPISHIRSPTLAMNGRNLLPGTLMQKALFLRKSVLRQSSRTLPLESVPESS
ncbi:hypothetical protein QYF36_013155 [Acer negundo]|nr:hypothetical protein QYF36_013155 [Acer negundo]